MIQEKDVQSIPHNIIMENRTKLSISGVNEVESFDEASVILITELGELAIRGNGLHISKINVESGDVSVEGEITALIYNDIQQEKGKNSVLKRLFK